MRIRGSSINSMCAFAGAFLQKYLVYLVASIVMSLLCETVAARNPLTGGPRYLKLGGEIQISEPEHLIDLMDPGNANDAWVAGARIRVMCNINMAAVGALVTDAPDLSRDLNGSGVLANIGGTQIGNNASPFLGTFDGGGYVISGLVLTGNGNTAVPLDTADGMFGVVGTAGAAAPGNVISNVILEAPFVGGAATDVGCLIGRLNNGTIFRCCILGPGFIFVGGGIPANWGCGGLVGQINQVFPSVATVNECFTQSFSVFGPTDVGGLVGRMSGGTISNSYAIGHIVVGVPGGTNPVNVGGFVGLNNLGVITSCYTDCGAPVGGPPGSNRGAFAGLWNWANALVVANFCDIADGPATNLITPAIGAPDAGVPVGPPPTAAANPVSAAALRQVGTYTPAWWGLGSAWVLPAGLTPRLLWRPF
ncbi:MAG: hypothetical protein M1376_14115 [Planctomycetes bacterium]|nr:hypothetical protein [Planctomycetota bacterium]